MKQNKQRIPRLGAVEVTIYSLTGEPVKVWQVWCVFCERWHSHGREAGHRVAHCHNDKSPYAETGYMLVAPITVNKKKKEAHGNSRRNS